MEVSKLHAEVLSRFAGYKKTMRYMSGDMPISALCLPKKLEKKLLDRDFLRVFELFDVDFTKVEWLDKAETRDLTARLNEFIAMF
jgi:hypothetical protein